VPPNILVGEGARVFAEEHGTLVVPNDSLVSKNARDRFTRWQEDLRRAEEKLKKDESRKVQGAEPNCPNTGPCQQYDTLSAAPVDSGRVGSAQQRDHANAILTGTWNEGQPDSPYRGTPVLEKQVSLTAAQTSGQPRVSPFQAPEKSPLSLLGTSLNTKARPSSRRHRTGEGSVGSGVPLMATPEGNRDGGGSPRTSLQASQPMEALDAIVNQPSAARAGGIKRPFLSDESEEDTEPRMDLITDTVGAIAIDEHGHIAAGSSSGGIGMKHRGRLGPAALVGIGTAVVPVDPADPDGICVATVTSGTGEHMATTMASQRCAERIYRSTRRGPAGQDMVDYDEDQIMESFVTQDFMGHPGVINCNSVGAIGVMTVKKTKTGYYLYFAHNTDSFALASMGWSDKVPQCVMSRLGEGRQVTRGARRIPSD
jgi:taspase, threonine aspartase, 1